MANIFTSNLVFLREQKGEGQTETATALGLTRSTYANYEIGENSPKLETIVKIIGHFKVSFEDLVNRDLQNVGNNQKRSFQKQQQNVGDNVGNSVGNKPKNYATNDVLTVTGEDEAEYNLTEKAAHGLNDISAAFQAVEATLKALNTNITNLEGRITLMEDKQKKLPG